MNTKDPLHNIIRWDWKEERPFELIAELVSEIPGSVAVEVKTDADFFAVIIVNRSQEAQAQEIYNSQMRELFER